MYMYITFKRIVYTGNFDISHISILSFFPADFFIQK